MRSAGLCCRDGFGYFLGWPWAHPIAALVIAAWADKEGRETWKGDSCCAPSFGHTDDTVENEESSSESASYSCCH